MSETIIQLSEKSSVASLNTLTANGDFEITLKDKVVVNDGDRVDLKSVFVDSVASSEGKITVDEDITDGFVEVIPYILNWTATDKNYNNAGVGDATELQNQPDGKVYYACTKINQRDLNLRKYESIAIAVYDDRGANPNSGNNPSPIVGGCTITISYTRNDGTKDTFKIPIPENTNSDQIYVVKTAEVASKLSAGDNTPTTIVVPEAFPNYKATGGGNDPRASMVLVSPSSEQLADQFNISSGFIDAGVQSQTPDLDEGFSSQLPTDSPYGTGTSTAVPELDGGFLHPRKKQVSFSVNKGEYYMSELCEIISDQITANGTLTTRPMNSALLTSDKQIKDEEGIPTDGSNTTTFIYYCSEDGSNVFRYANNVTNDFFIGSDQFGLVSDDATQKAKFVALHSSLYDNNGTVVVKYLKDGTRAGANLFQANKNGGVVISDLSPAPFWEKLGFGKADTPTHKSVFAKVVDGITLTKAGLNNLGVFSIDSTESVTTTGATKGIADAVVKTSGGNAVFDKVQDVNNLNIATQTTSQIFAQTGMTQSIQRDGYFKIRVDLGIQNDLVSNYQLENNIQGVISKYFSQDSYTSDMGQGSISYIHRGQPTFISRVRVRILNSNDDVDPNIGPDNTVFLSITRNQPS